MLNTTDQKKNKRIAIIPSKRKSAAQPRHLPCKTNSTKASLKVQNIINVHGTNPMFVRQSTRSKTCLNKDGACKFNWEPCTNPMFSRHSTHSNVPGYNKTSNLEGSRRKRHSTNPAFVRESTYTNSTATSPISWTYFTRLVQ